jgi:class 3 adenylate cyclase
VGETPNLAARLQGVAGPNEVVIAESRKLQALIRSTWGRQNNRPGRGDPDDQAGMTAPHRLRNVAVKVRGVRRGSDRRSVLQRRHQPSYNQVGFSARPGWKSKKHVE